MTRRVARVLVAFASGTLFGLGLLVSGMTRPAKVLAFLDPFGAWDPSLAFVMAGAVGVYALAVRSQPRAPLAAPLFSLAPAPRIDRRLLLGAATFGVGWGLAGYCPGPSLVSLATGGAGVFVFVAGMLLGNFMAAAAASDAHPSPPENTEALQG
ncbi:MAG TPA: YeeE/YedE family protein [Polyangiaceae bacterium]|nr:YeeE/YedE family protein [Polyangiaceae bacterium]